VSIKPIRKIDKLSFPHSIIFFDTESFIIPDEKRERHIFRLGVAIYIKLDMNCQVEKRLIYWYTSPDDFWSFVEKYAARDNVLWLFAHNAKYDLVSVDFIGQMKKRGWNVPQPVIANNFIMHLFKLKRIGERDIPYRKIRVLDTFNYLKTSVDSIGKKFDIPKIKLKREHSKIVYCDIVSKSNLTGSYKDYKNRYNNINFNAINDKKLFAYCQRDVEVIETFIINLIQFLHINKLGSLKSTLASTAFQIYRTRFITSPVYYHNDKTLLAYERKAYKGGRVDCLRIGRLKSETYYYIDVNSMYPYVMSNFKLPTKPLLSTIISQVESDDTLGYLGAIGIDEISNYTQSKYVIADVLVSHNHDIGVYGVKTPDKLLFPIGEFREVLHNEELKLAISNNEVKEIFNVVVYDSASCLSSYSNYFYGLKRNADNPIDREMAKLFMNSLYGRFALRKYSTEIIDLTETGFYNQDDSDLGEFIEHYKEGGIGKVKHYYKWYDSLFRSLADEFDPVKNTNVALAGSVTANARLLLYRYIQIAGVNNTFYCDTDSLFVNEEGYQNLSPYLDEKALGMLKLESKSNRVVILAPKNYIFGDKRKSKGIPSGAVSENGKYNYWRFTTLTDYLRNSGEFYGRVKVEKVNSLAYNKGIVLHETGIVTPFIMAYDKEFTTWDKRNVIQNQ